MEYNPYALPRISLGTDFENLVRMGLAGQSAPFAEGMRSSLTAPYSGAGAGGPWTGPINLDPRIATLPNAGNAMLPALERLNRVDWSGNLDKTLSMMTPNPNPQTQFQSDVSNFTKGLNPLHWWDVYSRNIGQPFQKWAMDYFNQPLAGADAAPKSPSVDPALNPEYVAMMKRMAGGPQATGGYAGLAGGRPQTVAESITPTIDFTQGLPQRAAPVGQNWRQIEAALAGMAPEAVPQRAAPAGVDTSGYRTWIEQTAPTRETIPENEKLTGILAALAGGLSVGLNRGGALGPAILASGAAGLGERHRQSREDRELDRRFKEQSRGYAGQRAQGELTLSGIEADNQNRAADVDYQNRTNQYQANEGYKQLRGRTRLAFLDREYDLANRTQDVEYTNALARYEAELKNRAQSGSQIQASGNNLIITEGSPDGKSRTTKIVRYEDTAKLLQQMVLLEKLSGGSLGLGGSGGGGSSDKTWMKNIPKGAIGAYGREAAMAASVLTNRVGADVLGLDKLEAEVVKELQRSGISGSDLVEQTQVRMFQRLIPLFAQNPELFLQIGKLQGF